MNTRLRIKAIGSLMLMLLVLFPRASFAQEAPQTVVFKKEELQQLLAPIALYPDQLLAQVLMASTYPLQVVQAARWQKDNAKLSGEALDKALDGKEWDASVKSIVPFPQVLKMMSDELEWTQKLGDAFLAQQADVMKEVQYLRAQAQKAGTLKTNEQQKVTTEQNIVVIQPANPQTIYVPVYDPAVIYGAWWYPSYPPYYYPPPPGSAFVAGVFWGAAIAGAGHYWGWGDCNWHGGDINIDIDRYNNISKNKISSKEWRHNPEHRGQVPYRDAKSREQFGAKASPVRASRDARGFESGGAKPDRATSGTSDHARAEKRDDTRGASRDAPKVESRDARKGAAERPASKDKVARTEPARKPKNVEHRSATPSRSPSRSAFDVQRGSDVRAHASRGHASRQRSAGGRRR
jgi:hypothetical protein